MFFEPINFVNNLHYLIKGEVGLFVALGIISLSIIILNKLSEKHWIIEDIKRKQLLNFFLFFGAK